MNIKKIFSSLSVRLFFLVLITVLLICLSINLMSCYQGRRVIKIGNQAVLSGEYKSFGEDQLVSIMLAASKLSPVRIGGFDYEIEIVTKDDKGDPEEAFLAAQEMVKEEVAGIIGSTFNGTTEFSIPVYEEYGIPIVSPSAQKTELSEMGDNFFRLVINSKQKIENIASFIDSEINPTKLMLINNREEYSIELVDYLKEILSDNGIESPEPMSVKIGEEDIADIAEYLLMEGPDAVFFCGDYSELASIMTAVREVGLDSRFITETLCMNDDIFVLTEPQNLEGLLAVIPDPPSLARYSQDPKAVDFWYDFNNYLDKLDDSNIGIDGPGQYAPYCYDSVFVLVEAMKKSNSILPKDYIDELKSTSYDGVIGHIEFDSNGDMVAPMSTVFVVKDGAWVRY
jgi:branched-chain amino acid transport system substrate-binding protein